MLALRSARRWANELVPYKLLYSNRLLQTVVQRDPRYAQLTPEDVQHFRQLLGDADVITDAEKLEPFNADWMKKYEGSSRIALRPRTTQAVSQVLAYCDRRRLAVVPQGGNTGLVGGSVPLFDEVVLSCSGMDRVVSMDEVSGVMVCEAGAVLQRADDAAAAAGYMMPLDLGAKGSCQIGGNVSTNAGGLRLLRYGSLHGSVLGIEAVLADGSVLDLLRTLRKDNTGYDLKQLFIGAEGTLGVVTRVAIQCAPRPASVQLGFFSCADFAAVQTVLRRARTLLAETLSAIEFLDSESMDMVTEHLPGTSNPLPPQQTPPPEGSSGRPAPFYVLVETHGSNSQHDSEKMEALLEALTSEGCVLDGTLASSEAQAAGIWRVREGVTEALVRRGAVHKYDLSMPVATMYELVEEMRRRVADLPGVRVVGYGHVGDGNLHLNISSPGPSYSPQLLQRIEPFVYEWTTRRRGSISAEHGLGQMKAACIGYSKPPEAVLLMARLKRVFDPNGILNPYKVLPPEASAASASSN